MSFWSKYWREWSWQKSLLLKTSILVVAMGGVLLAGWPQPHLRHHDRSRLSSVAHQSTATSSTPSSAIQATGVPTVDSLPLSGKDSERKGPQAVDAPLLIDLNKSSRMELQTLPGIGMKLADRIVSYRSIHGAFQEVEELVHVSGIGKKRLRRLEPFVTVKAKIVQS